MGFLLKEKHLPRYTVEDYERWQGDWELVEGIPYALASPSFKHQRLVLILAMLLELQLESNEACKDCKVVIDTDYVVNEYTVLRPDIAVVCDHKGDKITKPPKVVVEVISPSTKKVDEEIKPLIYAQEGVKYLLLVYPEREKMVCLVLKGERYESVPCGEEIEISPKGDCRLKLSAKGVWNRV